MLPASITSLRTPYVWRDSSRVGLMMMHAVPLRWDHFTLWRHCCCRRGRGWGCGWFVGRLKKRASSSHRKHGNKRETHGPVHLWRTVECATKYRRPKAQEFDAMYNDDTRQRKEEYMKTCKAAHVPSLTSWALTDTCRDRGGGTHGWNWIMAVANGRDVHTGADARNSRIHLPSATNTASTGLFVLRRSSA